MSFLSLRDVKTHFPVKKGILIQKVADVVKAVDGITLDIEQGEILGLVGESGCGKSTLSRTIMQLIPSTGGEIILEGQDLTKLKGDAVRKRRLDFQMIFQDPYASLNPRMTIFSTLAEALIQRHPDLRKDKDALTQKVSELMERVGLNPGFMKKYPHEFSGGQRQRIAIARALAPEPKLVIADEPVSALDVSIQSQILNLLLKLRDELNLTMIFITHDLSVVRYIADNIAVMYKGQLVEYGESERVFNTPEHAYTKKLLDAIPHLEEVNA
ncbi:oligopeptide transport system ATP-binding protein [Rubritalea squalenifaciens DSM 18772]|uniref:Oligopeptide transport system ATP-binding protein n=1 Tax=Rubritalea squalenifaciens DSM 18772 TaxID=1123071 RepID=A0A1M6LA78_9BACT|nr:ATP-binding cassette domain-containing protein [Rubritalea squalenifaciens]SHJ68107.1 oligopeptide transport system ATP-binding protein [Rubritalea squalenifaciens DSM 18772]